jgi:hypothetical protein
LLSVILGDAFGSRLSTIAAGVVLGWPAIAREVESVPAWSGSANAADVNERTAKTARTADLLIFIYASKTLKNHGLAADGKKASSVALDHQNVPSDYCGRGRLANRILAHRAALRLLAAARQSRV